MVAIEEIDGVGKGFANSDLRLPVCELPKRVKRTPTFEDRKSKIERRLPLRVGLLGLGTVGLGVYRCLAPLEDRFEVTRIAVTDPDKHRAERVPWNLLTTDPWEVLGGPERPCDVLVEVIGGEEPATSLIDAALGAGTDVVTANKLVMARCGRSLAARAWSSGAGLCYSAAVGGGVPVLETLAALAWTGPIRAVRGVLNGTCNYVLDRIAEGLDPEEAVREAQHKGFAEADPRLDLDGYDTACKVAISARVAFGAEVDPEGIARRGIDRLDPAEVCEAAAAGEVIRLVGWCRRTAEGVVAGVAPERVAADDPLSGARAEGNVVVIELEDERIRPVVLAGKGAGRWPTAGSVVGDLFRIARSRPAGAPGSRREECA